MRQMDGKTLQFEGVNTKDILYLLSLAHGKTLQIEGVNTRENR